MKVKLAWICAAVVDAITLLTDPQKDCEKRSKGLAHITCKMNGAKCICKGGETSYDGSNDQFLKNLNGCLAVAKHGDVFFKRFAAMVYDGFCLIKFNVGLSQPAKRLSFSSSTLITEGDIVNRYNCLKWQHDQDVLSGPTKEKQKFFIAYQSDGCVFSREVNEDYIVAFSADEFPSSERNAKHRSKCWLLTSQSKKRLIATLRVHSDSCEIHLKDQENTKSWPLSKLPSLQEIETQLKAQRPKTSNK